MIDNKRIQNIIRQLDNSKHNKSDSIPIDKAILITLASAAAGAFRYTVCS